MLGREQCLRFRLKKRLFLWMVAIITVMFRVHCCRGGGRNGFFCSEDGAVMKDVPG
jgi:hypothetical protein